MGTSKWLVILVFSATVAEAQINRYMVFFEDKDTASYLSADPETYLSTRAIERRGKQNISVTIQDFPVTKAYLSELTVSGASVFFTSKWMNGALIELDQSELTTIVTLDFVKEVEYVAPGSKLGKNPVTPPEPTSFLEPPGANSSSDFQLQIMNAHKMHEDGYKGEGMYIAVFDDGFEGVDLYNPFEALWSENRIIATKDFIRNTGNVFQFDDHGTAVFSTIGAVYTDVFSGTAPKANYILCVTEDVSSEYRIEEYNWLFAAEYVDSLGVDVINSSLGYSTFSDETMNYATTDMNGATTVVVKAANGLSERGVIVSVSAGNEGGGDWKYITSPGDALDALTVGSVKPDYTLSSFSSVGPTSDGRIKPDVCALGSQTSIVTGEGRISSGNGTSFASPQIAGLAAGIWQANPTWTSKQVMEAIRLSGSNSLSPDTATGFGIPNYALAVTGSTLSAADLVKNDITVYPNPFSNNSFTIDFKDFNAQGITTIKLIDANGKKQFQDRINLKSRQEPIEIKMDGTTGIYFLILENKAFTKTIKLVKI